MAVSVVARQETVADVVERVAPSVVSVSTIQIGRDPLFRPFPIEGMGSGVVLSDDGLLVTNFHVIRGARAAQVHLNDGRAFEARFVGGDRDSDVALLRIPASQLTPIRFGDSDALRVGETAIAIGSPFGFLLHGPTVTAGVVSALHRSLQADTGVIEDVIQTDAPINPGNSGGALLNARGELIGINTAIIPQAQGIGFAIPANTVRAIVDEVIVEGRVRRAWLGLAGVTVTPPLAKAKGLSSAGGVLVLQVEPESPSDQAGLEAGDHLTHINDRPLPSMEALRQTVRTSKPGHVLQVAGNRGSRRLAVRIKLQEKPS